MSEAPRNIGINSIRHYRFPSTAIASILHRISGVLLFIAIPFVILFFEHSLHSPKGFAEITSFFHCFWVAFFVWVFFSSLIYHFIAGIKHLLMDIGLFEGKYSGKIASWFVIVLAIVLILLLGAWMIW